MVGLVFWKDPSGCCVENGLEMGSHREGNQLGDWQLPGIKIMRLKTMAGGGECGTKLHRYFFF